MGHSSFTRQGKCVCVLAGTAEGLPSKSGWRQRESVTAILYHSFAKLFFSIMIHGNDIVFQLC